VPARSGETLNADSYVFACGPWLGKIFSFLSPIITPTRQEVFFFGTEAGDLRFTDARLPVWSDDSKAELQGFPGKHWFYGIPGNQWRGFKIADDTRGGVVDPTSMERKISDEGLAAARAYMRLRFPSLADAENVWIVGGGSGHGFKHGPTFGEMASDAVLGAQQPPTEFKLDRLLKGGSVRTS
jgi:sarcosine oxidase